MRRPCPIYAVFSPASASAFFITPGQGSEGHGFNNRDMGSFGFTTTIKSLNRVNAMLSNLTTVNSTPIFA